MNITGPAAGSYLMSDGTNIVSSEISTDDIKISENFKKEIAKMVRKEMGKVFLEMFLNGDLPLSESAKKYFADNI